MVQFAPTKPQPQLQPKPKAKSTNTNEVTPITTVATADGGQGKDATMNMSDELNAEDMEFSPDLIHPTKLVFSSVSHPELESDFLRNYVDKYLVAMQKAVLLACLIWFLFILNDILKNEEGQRRLFAATVAIRVSLVAGAVLCHYVVRSHPPYYQFLVMAVIVLFGTSQILFGVFEGDTTDPTYSVPVIFIASTSATFFRLRYFYALFCNVSICLIYLVLTVTTESYEGWARLALIMVLLLVGVVIFSLHAFSREYVIRLIFLSERRLAHKQAKSHRLLARMLPPSILNTMMSADGAEQFVFARHENVSVLFSHICDFDAHTALLPPLALVALLNDLFSHFDALTDHFAVYKVETIGELDEDDDGT